MIQHPEEEHMLPIFFYSQSISETGMDQSESAEKFFQLEVCYENANYVPNINTASWVVCLPRHSAG